MYEDDLTEAFPEDGSYPDYKCKQVELWASWSLLHLMPLCMCLFCGFYIPYAAARVGRENQIGVATRIFQIGAIVTAIFMLQRVIRWILLWLFGSEVKAKVCAYEEIENIAYGTKNLYMKLLVKRPDGYAYALWKVKDHNDLYVINTYLTIKAFKYDCALVKVKNKNKMNYCGTEDDLINLKIMADLEHSPEVLLENEWSASDKLAIAIFAGVSCFVTTLLFISCFTQHMGDAIFISLIMMPSAIVGWALLIKCLIPSIHYLQVNWIGRQVLARVWDYAPTNVILDESPIWKIKVLTYTDDGYRFLTFSMKSPEKPFEKDAIIELLVYKDYVLHDERK